MILGKEILEGFERHLTLEGVSKETKVQYVKIAGYFLEWLKSKNITPDVLREWKAYLSERKSPFTVNLYLSVARIFLKFLNENGALDVTVKSVKGVKKPKKHMKDILSDDEILLLFNTVKTDDLKGKRDLAILKLAAYTGLRLVSIQEMNVGDVYRKGGKWVMRYRGKGHVAKDKEIALHLDVIRALNSYLEERKKYSPFKAEDPMFISLSKNSFGKRITSRALRMIFDEYYRKAGIKGFNRKITAHSVRHTVITKVAVEKGVEFARQIADHANITTTMIYYHEAMDASLKADEVISYEENKE